MIFHMKGNQTVRKVSREEVKMISLSIIVPVYNTEKYLQKCLDSILAQTRKDFEVIVINDGSTDGSARIMQQYEALYPEYIRGIYQENHGIGYTRNKGIESAKGKYIAFIDSDDSIEPEYCQMLLEKMENSDLDLVVCDYYEVNELTEEKALFEIADFSDSNLKTEPRLLFDINISPWNKLYKTELIRTYNITFPEELKYEDTLFVLKYLCVAKKIGKVNKPLVDYLIRGGGETKTMNSRVFDIFVIFDELYKYFQEIGIYKNIQEYWEWFVINRITVYSIQQRFQRDAKEAQRFIDEGYSRLERDFPRWKKNRYYQTNNNIFKQILKNNRRVMKLYVRFARRGK